MTLDIDALRNLLCQRLCEDVGVEARPDRELMLRTHFRFPDGDSYPFHLSAAPAGGLRLSDRGHTLMHISYEHDIDSFLTGTRWALFERIVGESSLSYENGAFYTDTSVERLPEGHLRFRAGSDAHLRPDTPVPLQRRLHVLRRPRRQPHGPS